MILYDYINESYITVKINCITIYIWWYITNNNNNKKNNNNIYIIKT